ncbi:MAG: ABC transporter transmembrane domain-containing protein [Methylohalobius sp. ZOD2]
MEAKSGTPSRPPGAADSGGGLHALRGVLPFLKPYAGRLGLALILLTLAAGTALALPWAIRGIIDLGLGEAPLAEINRRFLLLLGLAAALALFASSRFYLVMWLGERIVADIRRAVYGHVIHLSPAFFEETRPGEVLSRLTADTTLVQSVVGAGISIALRSTFMLGGSLIMLTATNPGLTGLILVLVPLAVFPLIVFGRKVRRLSRESQDRLAEASAVAGETLSAMPMVQAFTLERLQTGRFAAVVESAFAAARRRILARSLLSAFAILVVFSAVLLVLWIGALDVIAGNMSVGELGQFLLYAAMVATASAALSEVWGEVQRAAGAMERLLELLHARTRIETSPPPTSLPYTSRGPIRFEAVTFHYPSRPGQAALRDFSLEVSAGERLALVGPSGAGKSTVFQLLLRFYDPQAGVIRLGGIPLRRVEPGELRRHIGIVPQETVIFADSARENIRYGRPEASDEEVHAAARLAAADDFIRALPEGYATFLGERGIRLSGGQRQRIAIARAILKNPPVLLLDEATSALDAESERLVQSALDRLMRGRTTLVIAHRLSTVLKADRIVVMDRGQMIAVGKHHELIQQGGLYARLAAIQFEELNAH